MNITDERFIQEVTHGLNSSLDIEQALFSAFNSLKKFFPLDLTHMFIYDMSRDTFRYLALATGKRGFLIDELIQISSRAKDELRGYTAGSVHIYNKSGSIMIQEIFDHFLKNTRNPLIGADEEFSSLGIVLDIGLSMAGGFSMVVRGPDRYDEGHKPKLRLLEGVLTGAVLNLLHHRNIVCQNEMLIREKDVLRKRLGHVGTHQIIGAESGLKEVMALVRYVAPTATPVLITGETGVGKELVAHAIHQESTRSAGPFICVNCGAIPESLIDSELFGHEKGAFTGAVSQKRGYFEQANGGTIFLDEIGELPLSSQVRFLRVLQAMEFQRVGGQRSITVDVRVIAATNRNLLSMVRAQQFREDLWFRLNVFPIKVPPLRERPGDIPAMARYFVREKAQDMNLPIRPDIDGLSMAALREYDWPGNIRELQNVIERALIVSKDGALSFPDLAPGPGPAAPAPENETAVFPTLDQTIVRHIEKALTVCGGRVDGRDGAARLLGINPSTLRGKMRKHGIRTLKTVRVGRDDERFA